MKYVILELSEIWHVPPWEIAPELEISRVRWFSEWLHWSGARAQARREIREREDKKLRSPQKKGIML